MPHDDPHSPSDIGRIVEKQMRNWELARAQLHEQRQAAPPPDVADFIAISRTLASGGSEVATLLGERLHWPVFDRELLQTMAGDDQVRARVYKHLDERDETWIEGAMHWVIAGELRTDDYFCRLTETILALTRQGPAVFLGRAADLILPREHGLRIRITAPLEKRAQAFALENHVTEPLARDELERIDQQREDFRRRHFGPTANDATRHDLILNLARFGPPQAADLIVAALHARVSPA
jgi:cytidylate kinase